MAAGDSTASSPLIPGPARSVVRSDRTASGGQNPTQATLVQSRFMPTMTLEPGQAFPGGG
jgi:hypothetical protein